MYLYSARIGVLFTDPSLNVFLSYRPWLFGFINLIHMLCFRTDHTQDESLSFSREALLVINGFFHPWTPSFLTYPSVSDFLVKSVWIQPGLCWSQILITLLRKKKCNLDSLSPICNGRIRCEYFDFFAALYEFLSGRDLGRIESNQSPSTPPFFV